MCIEYKHSTKLELKKALSRLLKRQIIDNEDFNHDWSLLVMRNKAKDISANPTKATRAMVLKRDDKFLIHMSHFMLN